MWRPWTTKIFTSLDKRLTWRRFLFFTKLEFSLSDSAGLFSLSTIMLSYADNSAGCHHDNHSFVFRFLARFRLIRLACCCSAAFIYFFLVLFYKPHLTVNFNATFRTLFHFLWCHWMLNNAQEFYSAGNWKTHESFQTYIHKGSKDKHQVNL